MTLVAANLAVAPPPGARVLEVQTAARAGRGLLSRNSTSCDVLLMAAAVADFRPAAPVANKLKKDAGAPPPIELEPTEDVLSALSARAAPGPGTGRDSRPSTASDAIGYGRGKLEAQASGRDRRKRHLAGPDIGFDCRRTRS